MQLLELGHQLSHGAIPSSIDNKYRLCRLPICLLVICVSRRRCCGKISPLRCVWCCFWCCWLCNQSCGLVVIIALQHYSYRRQQQPQQEQEEPKNSPMGNVTITNTVAPVHAAPVHGTVHLAAQPAAAPVPVVQHVSHKFYGNVVSKKLHRRPGCAGGPTNVVEFTTTCDHCMCGGL